MQTCSGMHTNSSPMLMTTSEMHICLRNELQTIRAHREMRYPNVTSRIILYGYLFTTELRHTCTPEYSWSNACISNERRFTNSVCSVPCYYPFLPERDYVTFGSLLSQFRLSSVCLSVCLSVCRLSVCLSVCNVGAPYSGGWSFLHRCVRWPSSDLRAKFYGDSPRGTPPSGALNARGYQNTLQTYGITTTKTRT